MMHVFHLSEDERPKRVAKLLQAELEKLGIKLTHRQCLDIVGEMLGHDSWETARREIGKAPPSPLDHETDDLVVTFRRLHHISVLAGHGVPQSEAPGIADRLRVTSSRSPARIEDTSSRITFLDLTGNQVRTMTPEESQLFATLMSREAHGVPAYSQEIDWESRAGFLLIHSGPLQRRLLSLRLADLKARITCGPIVYAAAVMKELGEPLIWADTFRELQRRTGEPVSLISWSTSTHSTGGIPSEEGTRSTIRHRLARSKSAGLPVHRFEVMPGEIGIVVAADDSPAFSARIRASDIENFQKDVGDLIRSRFPDPLESKEQFMRVQHEMVDSALALRSDPEVEAAEAERLVGGFLLWMCMNHPEKGQSIRDTTLRMAASETPACVTLTRKGKRFTTSVGPNYADIAAMLADVPLEMAMQITSDLPLNGGMH